MAEKWRLRASTNPNCRLTRLGLLLPPRSASYHHCSHGTATRLFIRKTNRLVCAVPVMAKDLPSHSAEKNEAEAGHIVDRITIPVLPTVVVEIGTSSPELQQAQPATSLGPTGQQTKVPTQLEINLGTLEGYYSSNEPATPAVLWAAKYVKELVSRAVNNKDKNVRALQASVVERGGVRALLKLANDGHSIAYEALQILCYRNVAYCQTLVKQGIVDMIARKIVALDATIDLKCAMCFLLTALAAFSDESHAVMVKAGLIPHLVALCRFNAEESKQALAVGHHQSTLQARAAAVLRNLAHNNRNHTALVQAGAVDALIEIVQTEKDAASRINAAVAMACLVGQEENNPRLQLDAAVLTDMFEVLSAASHGKMMHGVFWTVWKLCQGIACLSINDANKDLITRNGGVQILADVLMGRHHNVEAAHRFALSGLWNLAFNEQGRTQILQVPGLVGVIRQILASSENQKTREAAKGCLWTLGLEEDKRNLQELGRSEDGAGSPDDKLTTHIMLSYEWGNQATVLLIKSELEKMGYKTWMDVDKMSGSTLEAMARAVEDSAAVLVCVSKRYKESQACRTEAEYAFQQRKKIVPLLMERDYKPSGWLGALLGTKLYFNFSDPRTVNQKLTGLVKELGDLGKTGAPGQAAAASSSKQPVAAIKTREPAADGWAVSDVEEWLRRIRCSDYVAAFRQHDIDGMALYGMYRLAKDPHHLHSVLHSYFSMTVIGHRLRLVEELHRLFD